MGRRAGLLVLVCVMAGSLPASAQADPLDALVANDLQYAAQQLQRGTSVTPVARYPYETPSPSGPWTTSDRGWWTSGFFPGSLWLMYQATGDPMWRDRGRRAPGGARVAGEQHIDPRRRLHALHHLRQRLSADRRLARAHAHLVGAIRNYGATDLLHAGEHAADRSRQIGQLAEIPVPARDVIMAPDG